jgi:hypothetical protein
MSPCRCHCYFMTVIVAAHAPARRGLRALPKAWIRVTGLKLEDSSFFDNRGKSPIFALPNPR